jgi:hypothetical protein
VQRRLTSGHEGWPGDHVAMPAGRHFMSYHLSQEGGAPPWPINTPPTGESRHTHHILEIPLAKLSFLV